jgi:3-oxoadipate enol-lactonase
VSFGGMVAQELLVRHPHRVTRAVLACTSSGGAGGASYPLDTLTGRPVAERLATYVPLMDTRWTDPSYADPLRGFIEEMVESGPPPDDGALAQLATRRGHDTWDRLPGVTAEVLVCAGRYDGIAPLTNSEALAGQIPGARLQVFDGGHGFMYQDPTALEAMRTFLLG